MMLPNCFYFVRLFFRIVITRPSETFIVQTALAFVIGKLIEVPIVKCIKNGCEW